MVSARLRAMERKLVLEWAEVCLEGMVNNLVIQWNIAMQMDWPLTELGLTIYCLGVTVRGNSRTATPRPAYRLSAFMPLSRTPTKTGRIQDTKGL